MFLPTDCLMLILDRLSFQDQLKCRLVSKQWCLAVDKVFSGQKKLNVFIKNTPSSIKSSNPSFSCSRTSNHPILMTLNHGKLNTSASNFMTFKLPNISSLTISNLTNLSDIIFFLPSSSQTNIKHFYDSLSHYVDDQELELPSMYERTSVFDHLQGHVWHFITRTYSQLTSLSLISCSLTDAEMWQILASTPQLKQLDLSRSGINRNALKSLGNILPSLEELTCGDLTSRQIDSSLDKIIACITHEKSPTFLKKLTINGFLSPLIGLRKLSSSLKHLELNFISTNDHELDQYNPRHLSELNCLSNLKCLHLKQIRCFDRASAIDDVDIISIAKSMNQLEQLSITGDYGWQLRLTDDSLSKIGRSGFCPNLKRLKLSGFCPGITNEGIECLASFSRLNHLTLSCFDSINEKPFVKLMNSSKHDLDLNLNQVPVDSSLILSAISICQAYPERRIKLKLCGTKIDDKILEKKNLSIPSNLIINLEQLVASKRRAIIDQDQEPSKFQIMIVMIISVLILLMALLTTFAVIVVPCAMLLMMAHEWLFTNLIIFNSDPAYHDLLYLNKWIQQFRLPFNFNLATLRQVYIRLKM